MKNRAEKEEHGQLFCRYRNNGDMRAFERLLSEYEKPLYSYLLRFLRNPADAEDALQEVWLKVVRRAETYNERGRFSSWLYRIARNHSMDVLRRRKPDMSLDDGFKGGEMLDRVDFQQEAEKNPFESLEEKELLDYLDEAAETLSPALREVFFLRTSGGLSFREISEVLECPLGTVLGRMHQAVNRIKKHFADVGLVPTNENSEVGTA